MYVYIRMDIFDPHYCKFLSFDNFRKLCGAIFENKYRLVIRSTNYRLNSLNIYKSGNSLTFIYMNFCFRIPDFNTFYEDKSVIELINELDLDKNNVFLLYDKHDYLSWIKNRYL